MTGDLGDNALCATCGGRVEQYDPTGDGLASFWSHEKHPDDGHDAEPVPPENIMLVGGERDGWCYREKDWQIRREATQHALSQSQHVHDDVTGYQPTGEIEAPATRPGAWCAVWRWSS